jgi:formiminoglutamase
MAYEEMEKLVSVLNVDAKLDMEEEQEDLSKGHVQKILLHDPNYLFHYSQLAYHSYLVDEASLNVLGKLGFDTHRIGGIRKDTEEMEPIIRNADMLSFDLQATRGSNAPGQQDPLPFGLSGEEACQICWYAGLNEKLSSIGIYGFHPNRDVHGATSMIIATMIWYFVEGYYHRKKELSFAMNDYLKYVVSMPDDPETLVFYKSKVSEKWWLEVPGTNQKSFFARERIIPCSYADYEAANRGEVPERYISSLGKLS